MRSNSGSIFYMTLLLCGILMQSGSAHAATKKNMYDWLSYERDLFLLASEPGPEYEARFEATLRRIINQADEVGRKPAPGLLAEYGYFYYERGEYEPAITYFERERSEWPESATLMNRMIQQAQERAGQ